MSRRRCLARPKNMAATTSAARSSVGAVKAPVSPVPRKERPGKLSGISPELRAEMIAMESRGESLANIGTWLKERHSITVSDTRLSAFLARERMAKASTSIADLLFEGCERLAVHAPEEALKLKAACFEALMRSGVIGSR